MQVAPKGKHVTDAIHIVHAADARYVMPLAVAICSTAANCNRSRRLVFRVIQHGIGGELRKKVESSLLGIGFPNATIHWLPIKEEQFADLVVTTSHLSRMSYGRLLIPQLMPVEVEKVLYLDCDLVVKDDVGKLSATKHYWQCAIAGSPLLVPLVVL
jgi:lipopolysaccharide biosynthesis glycosyltransferase